MAEKNLETRSREIAGRRNEAGSEIDNYQDAQSQLLAIQGAQQQNLNNARAQSGADIQQLQMLSNAGNVLAQSVNSAPANVNPATQQALSKYGLNQPKVQKSQSHSQQVTKQNITINNNTTNTTTNNVQTPQVAPAPSQNNNSNSTEKFKVWLNNTMARQNEEAAKREREYDKKGEALTRDGNRMLRKLSEFGKAIYENLDPSKLNTGLKSQLKSILFLFGFQYLASNWVKILKTVARIEGWFKRGLQFLGVDIKSGWDKAKFEIAKSELAGTFMTFLTGKEWKAGSEVRGADILSGLRDLFLGDGSNGKPIGLIKVFTNYFERKWEEKSEAAKMLEMPKLDWKDPSGALTNMVNYLGQVLGVYLGDPKKFVKSAMITKMRTEESDRIAKTRKENEMSTYESLRTKDSGFYMRDDQGLRGAEMTNTDVGDYNLFSKDGKKGLSSRYLQNGNLTSGAGAEIAQMQELSSIVTNAQNGSNFDAEAFVSGMSRAMERAKEKGKIAVPVDFIENNQFLTPEDLLNLQQSGGLRKTNYYWVRREKSGRNFHGDSSEAYHNGSTLSKISDYLAAPNELLANVATANVAGYTGIDEYAGYLGPTGVVKMADRFFNGNRDDKEEHGKKHTNDYETVLVSKKDLRPTDEILTRDGGDATEPVYELTPEGVQYLSNKITGAQTSIDALNEDYFNSALTGLTNIRKKFVETHGDPGYINVNPGTGQYSNVSGQQRLDNIRKQAQDDLDFHQRLLKESNDSGVSSLKSSLDYSNIYSRTAGKFETENFKFGGLERGGTTTYTGRLKRQGIRSEFGDFYNDLSYDIFDELGITADNIATFDISSKEFQDKLSKVKLNGKIIDIKDALRQNRELSIQLANNLAQGPKMDPLHVPDYAKNTKQNLWVSKDGKTVISGKQLSHLPPEWEGISDISKISDWVKKYSELPVPDDYSKARWSTTLVAKEAVKHWKNCNKYVANIYKEYIDLIENSSEILRESRSKLLMQKLTDFRLDTKERRDNVYKAQIRNEDVNTEAYANEVLYNIKGNYRGSVSRGRAYDNLYKLDQLHKDNQTATTEEFANSRYGSAGKYVAAALNGAENIAANVVEAVDNGIDDASKGTLNIFNGSSSSQDANWDALKYQSNNANWDALKYQSNSSSGSTTDYLPSSKEVQEQNEGTKDPDEGENFNSSSASGQVPTGVAGKQLELLKYFLKWWGKLRYVNLYKNKNYKLDPEIEQTDENGKKFHGTDCSGMTFYAYLRTCGINIGGWCGSQLKGGFKGWNPGVIVARGGIDIEGRGYTEIGKHFKFEDLRPGDLILTRRYRDGVTQRAVPGGGSNNPNGKKILDYKVGHSSIYAGYKKTWGCGGNNAPYQTNMDAEWCKHIIVIKRYIGYEDNTDPTRELTEQELAATPMLELDKLNLDKSTFEVGNFKVDEGSEGTGDSEGGSLLDRITNKLKDLATDLMSGKLWDDTKSFVKNQYNGVKTALSGLIDPKEEEKSVSFRDASRNYDGPIYPEFVNYGDYMRNHGVLPPGLNKLEWQDLVYDKTGRSPADLNVDEAATNRRQLDQANSDTLSTLDKYTADGSSSDDVINAVAVTKPDEILSSSTAASRTLASLFNSNISDGMKSESPEEKMLVTMNEVRDCLAKNLDFSKKTVELMAVNAKASANNVDATRGLGTIMAQQSIVKNNTSVTYQQSSTKSGSSNVS